MATRSATIVTQRTYTSAHEYKVVELFRFYRHFDGYPAGHGMDLANACLKVEEFIDKTEVGGYGHGLNNRNWAQYVFGQLFNMDVDIEIEPRDEEHWDLSYLYVLEGSYDAYGGKVCVDALDVRIRVYDGIYRHEGYERAMRQTPLFDGTPREFVEWVKKEG